MDENCKSSSDQMIDKSDKAVAKCDSLEALTADGFKMLVEATRKSNNLPFGKTRHLYESYPSFHSVVETQLEQILKELSTMMACTNCSGSIHRGDDEDKFEKIVDANDTLLENVGISLDELSGIHKNPDSKSIEKKTEFAKASWNRSKNSKISNKAASHILNSILSQTKHIEKPQLKFNDKVNNDPEVPFEPRIKYKYNMLKPLSCLLPTTESGTCHFTHPYEFELNKFTPTMEQMTCCSPIKYKSLSETPLVMVNSVENIAVMINDLEKYEEIAVDMEHHSYRSFQGFTCLLQISTRDTDYVIDALALRSELDVLNKIFTNPSIVKVFHGADLDILWLQKDFSVYVVNMFDTHQAAKLLNFPKLSLAYLLSHYCNVEAQKHFQLADWRIRPLPQELLTYAREDTHYLLYIYDRLKNVLFEKANNQMNFIKLVISESTRICLKTYIKPQFESDGYMDMYRRSKKLFDNRQKYALQQLFQWRDEKAREWDESYAYILPDHMMLNISEILPREAQGILACCNPVPVPVRQNLLALHQIILKARDQPLIKPILEEQKFYRHTAAVSSLNNPLLCPHDLNHEPEFRDDLPVLCTGNSDSVYDENKISPANNCSSPIIDIFEKSKSSSDLIKLWSIAKSSVHLTPYRLYQLSKNFSESIELKNVHKTQNNSDKVQDSTSQSDDYRAKANNTISENSEVNDIEIIQTSNPKKRKSDEEQPTRVKKEKKENNEKNMNKEVSGIGPKDLKLKEIEDKNVEDLEKKKEKKKKNLTKKKTGNKKEFEPFDYSSVDFDKYKSSNVQMSKKVGKIRKSKKRKGRKNFKISV